MVAILLFCIGEEGFHEVRGRREQLVARLFASCEETFVEERLRVETDDVFVQLRTDILLESFQIILLVEEGVCSGMVAGESLRKKRGCGGSLSYIFS